METWRFDILNVQAATTNREMRSLSCGQRESGKRTSCVKEGTIPHSQSFNDSLVNYPCSIFKWSLLAVPKSHCIGN